MSETYKEKLSEHVEKIFKGYAAPGLHICDIATGGGKSYTIGKLTCEYYPERFDRIIILCVQNKLVDGMNREIERFINTESSLISPSDKMVIENNPEVITKAIRNGSFQRKNSMTRQHIVFLTGAGVSVESGLSTFRGKDGLWTNEEWAYLASTDALYNDTQKCLDFYNIRRRKLAEVEPNDAHRMIAELEKEHQVTVITQNVDNLHERAGSSHVIHLHGELSKVCSMDNRTTCVKEYPLTTPIKLGDLAEDGSQLRPYIVMFGEYIDSMNVAIDYVSNADIFVVIGTSLQVYPAAGFIHYAHHEVPKFVIDPGDMEQCAQLGFTHFKTTATEGMKMLIEAFKNL